MPDDIELPEGETVEIEDLESDVEDTEDGGAIIKLRDEEDTALQGEHFANIVEEVNQQELRSCVSNLLDLIEKDKEARSERDKLYQVGLQRTGLANEAPGGAQFDGANKVVHPLLVEACVDFSARVMKEIMPPSGPAKAKIFGDRDKAKLEKAQRKTEFMNRQLTEEMPEFRGELEQLTTQEPLGGSQYLKLRWSKQHGRPVAEFVPIDNMLIPFAATNFYTADRKTHMLYLTQEAYEQRVAAGEYIDTLLTPAGEPEFTKAQVANDKIEGRKATGYNEDGLRLLYEVSLNLDIEEEDTFKPYILTIDDSSMKAVALYRNWDVGDENFRELDWVAEFPFVPWRGAYAIGLTHLIGHLSGAATGALRALLDSAHINNMPTAIKLKGGPASQTLNLQPTQIVDIEANPNTDDIRKVVMPLPFNQPSPVLFQLLGFLVDAGKGVVQTSFEKLSDASPNQPVGTTMALIEQGMVVFSSIHSRQHAAMARVLKILHRINSAYLTPEILKARYPGAKVQPSDFDGPIDVVPVTDPNIHSEAQRFAQINAVQQRSTLLPQLYDMRKVEEMFLRSMKMDPSDVLVPKPGEDDVDPVSENVAMAMAQPTYVLPKQDHVAHIKVHMAFMNSKLFGLNPVVEKDVLLPMTKHLQQHLLNYYLVETHNAVKKGTEEGLIIKDDAEAEATAVEQVQRIIERDFAALAEILPAMDQAAMKYMPQPPKPADPAAVAQINAEVQTQAIQQREQSDARRAQTQQAIEAQKLQDKEQQRQADLTEVQIREQGEDRRTAEEIAARKAINAADNLTAIQITDTKIAAGDAVGNLSTGTGIGFNP